MGESMNLMVEEKCYRVFIPNVVEDFIWAEDLKSALKQATEEYGTEVAVREAFYKEWNCGGNCGYDDLGNHIEFDKTE
jgi:hypothetical protein